MANRTMINGATGLQTGNNGRHVTIISAGGVFGSNIYVITLLMHNRNGNPQKCVSIAIFQIWFVYACWVFYDFVTEESSASNLRGVQNSWKHFTSRLDHTWPPSFRNAFNFYIAIARHFDRFQLLPGSSTCSMDTLTLPREVNSSIRETEAPPEVVREISPGHRAEEYQRSLSTRCYRFSERTPSSRPQESNLKKRRRLLSGQRCALLDSGWVCCERRRCIHEFDKDLLQSRRSSYLGMRCFERKIVLKSMLQDDGTFRFEGTRVCQRFITQILTFSNSVIAAVKELPHARASPRAHPIRREGLSDSVKFDILVFLRRLAESCGDRMPDSNEIHLPYHVKADVFKIFMREARRPEHALYSRCVSESYFYSVWKKGAAQIKTRKIHRFTKCADCEFYRAELARVGLDLEKGSLLKQAKSVHINHVMQERLEYASKRDQARRMPEKYCSFIIDGADQSAYGLPHLIYNTKAMRGEKLKVRLIGIKEHLPIPNIFFFLMTEEFETGANHVIEAVHRFLTQKADQGPIPPTLYVQADNCWRENKNKYLMSYFETLVGMGVVVEVFVSFLPIGHTHEDIDQVFSRTAVHLRAHDAATIHDLAEELSVSYSPRPKVSRIAAIANFSGLCDATRCLHAPPAWTNFQYFHFYRAAGDTCVPYQRYCTNLSVRESCSSAWKPFHGNRGFLKFAPDLRQTPPTILISPQNYDAVIRALETSETLINDSAKMDSLRALNTEVYSDREQPFHWNRKSMIELNGKHLSISQRPSSEGESTELLSFEYSYDRGDMVAARPDDSSDLFSVAQVENVQKDGRGVAKTLRVRWFEPSGAEKSDPFEAAYVPAFLNQSSLGKKAPWVDEISVSTILVTFGSLSRKHKIKSYTAKKIRDALNV